MHFFWEVRDGKTGRFWEDSWQQSPRLSQDHSLADLMPFFHSCEAMTIKYYWHNQPDKHGWHQWKTAEDWPIYLPHQGSDRLAQYLSQQKIHASQGSNKLRWDLSTSGVFSVKEAYLLRAAVSIIPNTQVWKRIWTSHLWPKVAHFL